MAEFGGCPCGKARLNSTRVQPTGLQMPKCVVRIGADSELEPNWRMDLAGDSFAGRQTSCSSARRNHKDGVHLAVTGYCLRCKEKREIKDPQAITMKNGKPATTGTCPVCGTKIYKIGKA